MLSSCGTGKPLDGDDEELPASNDLRPVVGGDAGLASWETANTLKGDDEELPS